MSQSNQSNQMQQKFSAKFSSAFIYCSDSLIIHFSDNSASLIMPTVIHEVESIYTCSGNTRENILIPQSFLTSHLLVPCLIFSVVISNLCSDKVALCSNKQQKYALMKPLNPLKVHVLDLLHQKCLTHTSLCTEFVRFVSIHPRCICHNSHSLSLRLSYHKTLMVTKLPKLSTQSQKCNSNNVGYILCGQVQQSEVAA